MRKIRVGTWRETVPVRCRSSRDRSGASVSTNEGPAAGRLEQEMNGFLECSKAPALNTTRHSRRALPIWFVTIHPFDDGNGSHRTCDCGSCPGTIRAQRATLLQYVEPDSPGCVQRITTSWNAPREEPWTSRPGWSVPGLLTRAIDGAQPRSLFVLTKARFWQTLGLLDQQATTAHAETVLLEGFEGHLTTSKWATIAKCSSDTALREHPRAAGSWHSRAQPRAGPQHQLLAR